MNRRITKALPPLVLLLAAMACSDDVTSTYSTKYRVMCGFQVVSYAELTHVVGNFGQFASIRKSGDEIIMSAASSTTHYPLDALSKDFRFGLGGIIVGTDRSGNYRAYDLACPNCDRAERRLTLRDDGTAKCARCGIVYDMNNDGVINNAGSGMYNRPRGLYRYPVTYDGMRLNIVN